MSTLNHGKVGHLKPSELRVQRRKLDLHRKQNFRARDLKIASASIAPCWVVSLQASLDQLFGPAMADADKKVRTLQSPGSSGELLSSVLHSEELEGPN